MIASKIGNLRRIHPFCKLYSQREVCYPRAVGPSLSSGERHFFQLNVACASTGSEEKYDRKLEHEKREGPRSQSLWREQQYLGHLPHLQEGVDSRHRLGLPRQTPQQKLTRVGAGEGKRVPLEEARPWLKAKEDERKLRAEKRKQLIKESLTELDHEIEADQVAASLAMDYLRQNRPSPLSTSSSNSTSSLTDPLILRSSVPLGEGATDGSTGPSLCQSESVGILAVEEQNSSRGGGRTPSVWTGSSLLSRNTRNSRGGGLKEEVLDSNRSSLRTEASRGASDVSDYADLGRVSLREGRSVEGQTRRGVGRTSLSDNNQVNREWELEDMFIFDTPSRRSDVPTSESGRWQQYGMPGVTARLTDVQRSSQSRRAFSSGVTTSEDTSVYRVRSESVEQTIPSARINVPHGRAPLAASLANLGPMGGEVPVSSDAQSGANSAGGEWQSGARSAGGAGITVTGPLAHAAFKPVQVKKGKPLPDKWDGPAGTVALVDKPVGWTSFTVCGRLRKALGIQKVGHAGTLDPLATGLLVVCLGKATKLADSYQAMQKVYSGIFRLGEATPSYDSDTPVDERLPWEYISEEDLHAAAERHMGDLMQIPPMYSAIKVRGKQAVGAHQRGGPAGSCGAAYGGPHADPSHVLSHQGKGQTSRGSTSARRTCRQLRSGIWGTSCRSLPCTQPSK
eukprot:TRINITY_DN16826_c0_g1_i5.p1 TRINITY_DN16826_c0_g1~~TRINITY_DN16826_c0_g1_i5.p1  ORF type:complete len:755 (+),score=58.55 TRINITY_DN16826_c0_g1_i5:228-2267(+)